MAVFQGARPRNVALPAEPAVRTRRASPPAASTRSASGVRPMGLLMAAILATTMLGLVYLTQTLGSNATSSEIGTLAGNANKLRNSLGRQDLLVLVNTDPVDLAKRARDLKLKPLDATVVLPAP